jgi:heme A synthase
MFSRRLLLLITVLVLLVFSVTIGWYAATWQQPPDRVNEIIDEMAR